MKYVTITKSLIIRPPQEPIFSELATEIYLEDEAAGLFVVIQQNKNDNPYKISICKEEWHAIRQAVDQLMERC